MSAVAVCSAWAASPAYTYQIVAKTGDVIGGVTLGYFTETSISDDGTVLFVEGQPSGTAILSANVVTGKRSVVVPPMLLDGFAPTVNSVKRNLRGEIVYDVFLPLESSQVDAEELLTPSGAVALPGETIQGLKIVPAGHFALNDAGELVFDASNGVAGSLTGIFTPSGVIVKSGETYGGVSLTSVSYPALSSSGALAFLGGFSKGTEAYTGIFSNGQLVIKNGDAVSGNSVFSFNNPVLSKFGVPGYTATFVNSNLLGFVIDHSVIAQSGDIIDGVTVNTPTDFNGSLLSLNIGGEALFASSVTTADGVPGIGLFTAKHSVVATGDTIAGLTAQDVDFYNYYSGSINGGGQISFVMTFEENEPNYAIVVATPVDGTPLPPSTSYKMQDPKGNIIDLGWALNPEWGEGSFAYLYSFNSSVNQQVTYTADGKLQSVTNPSMYLYNDGGHLALGGQGDTFVIEQKGGAFTVKDGAFYLQSPQSIDPPNKLAFTSNPAVWAFINASPTNSVK